MLVLFAFLMLIHLANGKIDVKEGSIAALSHGDIGMIFYLTVFNTDDKCCQVYVKMIKCCETITEGDTDCELMKLIGGDMGVLRGKCSKNITLLYPNMYLHDRKGNCVISVSCQGASKRKREIQKVIKFNTTVTTAQVLPIMRDFYNPRSVKLCKTVDLDPLENCEPVNCYMKYLGYRNYFNYQWNRCQTVPYCISDTHKELPDVAYIPASNKCRDLECSINKTDIVKLVRGIATGDWTGNNFTSFAANIRCHHGVLDEESGLCVCEEGWTSAPLDKEQFEPTLYVYHMCNIETGTWNGLNRTKIKTTILLIAVAGVCMTMAILIVSFFLQLVYRCLKSFEGDDEGGGEDFAAKGGGGVSGYGGDVGVTPDEDEEGTNRDSDEVTNSNTYSETAEDDPRSGRKTSVVSFANNSFSSKKPADDYILIKNTVDLSRRHTNTGSFDKVPLKSYLQKRTFYNADDEASLSTQYEDSNPQPRSKSKSDSSVNTVTLPKEKKDEGSQAKLGAKLKGRKRRGDDNKGSLSDDITEYLETVKFAPRRSIDR